ncbi:hypothetical protein GCM10011410_31860 [Hoyosella rhizosphaerae]|uniref:DUF6779 domain-containing protein n=2 Tax=Hoyosella rhizosphaerae TaxID=1755582 RepID=A0A916UMH4_9ACTN|nr:hypothetical protein GCM10011410_31860 [Hoyosella rhizosphaerae]
MGIVVALWAAILGALAVAKYRKEAEAERTRIRDMRVVYELQLSREIAARRRHEMTVESRIRRELESESQADTAEQVAALRHELASMRGHIEYAISNTADPRRELTAKPHGDVRELVVSDNAVTDADPGRTEQQHDQDVVDAEFETEYQPSAHAKTR